MTNRTVLVLLDPATEVRTSTLELFTIARGLGRVEAVTLEAPTVEVLAQLGAYGVETVHQAEPARAGSCVSGDELHLPAVLSVTDGANQPRFPGFKLIMAARCKVIEVWSPADLGLDPAVAGSAGARTETLSAAPRPARPEVELVTDKGEGGVALADFLIRNDLV